MSPPTNQQPVALPVAQTTLSNHWREQDCNRTRIFKIIIWPPTYYREIYGKTRIEFWQLNPQSKNEQQWWESMTAMTLSDCQAGIQSELNLSCNRALMPASRLFTIPSNRARCIQKLCRSSRDVKEPKVLGWRSLTIRVRFCLGSSSMELEICFHGGHLLWINCNCKKQLTDWRQRSSTVLVIVLVLG